MSHDRGCPCGREKYEYNECTNPLCYKALEPGPEGKVDEWKLGHRLVMKPAPTRDFRLMVETAKKSAEPVTSHVAASSTPVEQLREQVITALTKIHDRRYVRREAVSAFNAFEMFAKANREHIETYDQIGTLIKALKNE